MINIKQFACQNLTTDAKLGNRLGILLTDNQVLAMINGVVAEFTIDTECLLEYIKQTSDASVVAIHVREATTNGAEINIRFDKECIRYQNEEGRKRTEKNDEYNIEISESYTWCSLTLDWHDFEQCGIDIVTV